MPIIDFLGHSYDCSCLGCAIAGGEIVPPGGIIWQGQHFVLHQDPEVPIPGFLIIAARQHVRSLADLDTKACHELADLTHSALSCLKGLGIAREFTLVQEERSRHLHVWLFPWLDWMDGRFAHSVTSLREVMACAKANCRGEEEVRRVLVAVERVRGRMMC